MPLITQLEDVTGEIRFGTEPQAVIRYRRIRAGDIDDAIAASTDRRNHTVVRRYDAELWGRLILGWEGIIDTKGQPVPFTAPPDVVDRVRAQAKEEGLALAGEDLARRAQGEWVCAVIRGFPVRVKTALQSEVNVDVEQVAGALGN